MNNKYSSADLVAWKIIDPAGEYRIWPLPQRPNAKPGFSYLPLVEAARQSAEVDNSGALIVRDCCEADPADPALPDTICISVGDLEAIVKSYTSPMAEDRPNAQEAWKLAGGTGLGHAAHKLDAVANAPKGGTDGT